MRLQQIDPLLNNCVLRSRYEFWDAEHDDDASFERRVDSLVREIGERGKIMAEATNPTELRPVSYTHLTLPTIYSV